jgi:O-antigen ligase
MTEPLGGPTSTLSRSSVESSTSMTFVRHDSVVTVSEPRRSQEEPRVGSLQLLTLAVAMLLPLIFHQGIANPFWTPRAALVAMVAGPGLVVALQAAMRGGAAARIGIAFLASAAISTALSDRPLMAVAGAANAGTGLLYLVALVGIWALGTRLAAKRRSQLELVLVAGACLNGLLAWIRLAGPPGVLFSYPGGAQGFLGNSTMLGALCAGGLWLLADRIGRRRGNVAWLVAVALLAGGAQLSVQRAAIGLSALALIVPLRKATRARAAAVVLAAVVGFVAAGVLATRPSVALSSSTARTFSTGALSDTRPETWRVALSVAMRQPVLGYGPGRFTAAVEPHATAKMTEGNAAWGDAHNFVVNSVVTVGLLGTGLLLGWLAFAARRARGPLGGFAIIIGLFSLVEPQYMALTPLGLLALGAAGEADKSEGVTLRGPWLFGAWCLGAAGAVLAASLLLGSMLMSSALNNYSTADARRASSLLRPWPDPLMLQAAIENHYELLDPHVDSAEPIATAREAVRRDPGDVRTWVLLGGLESRAGNWAAAADAYRRALLVFPWHGFALERRAEIAQDLGDQPARDEACRKLAVLRISADVCHP